MKVFISWSGTHSRKLGEALRDWLPGVLQAVTPYFTPSDIEKGTRWATDIGKQLSESQVGILCVTRDNIHSDWILFEAGALSKSLDNAHVCPILFGISNTDLAGPLKQFQTTEFEKGDMHRMLGVINGRLADLKLPQKTLDSVFEKWWPDLELKIKQILEEVEEPDEPVRSDREILEEVLHLNRVASKRSGRPSNIHPTAIEELLTHVIELHDDQAARNGHYQDVLNILQKSHKAMLHVSGMFRGESPDLDKLILKYRELSYSVDDGARSDEDEDIQF
jgi:hypothetical protein